MRLPVLAPSALYGGLAIATVVGGCGSRSELDLSAHDQHDGDASVVRDAAALVDRDHRDSEPDSRRDAATIDRHSPADGDSGDAAIAEEDGATDAVFDVGRDAPLDARDAAVVDAAKDSPSEARDGAAADITDSPSEALDAADGATDEGTGVEAAVDASSDGSTCDLLGPPARRFNIGVVESPTGMSFVLPDGGLTDALEDCLNRMTSVFGAYATVERIPLASIDDRLPRYDLAVLCSDWAETDWVRISPHAAAFTRYVTGGGGLLMYQPNLTTRVDLLPAWYTVQYLYTDSSVSIVADHPVTCGLTSSDIPYPADRITDFAPEWVALARGDQSGAASLLVAELGAGRAAVDAGHNSKYAFRTESDRFLERLGRWLMRSLP